MPSNAKRFRVFVASPGDVRQERAMLGEVIADLNHTIGATEDVILELVRWETHSFPAAGRPQAVINEQVGRYDVFIGIMWERFGTPTGVAASGTAEEFKVALDAWSERGSPHIAFYFRKPRLASEKKEAVKAQLAAVKAFKSQVAQIALIAEYNSVADFEQQVTKHLYRIIALLKKAAAADERPKVTARRYTTLFRTRVVELFINNCTVEIRIEATGREIILHDGAEVSNRFSAMGAVHTFEVTEDGDKSKYDVEISVTVRMEFPLLVPAVTVRRNGVLIYSDK